MISSLMISQVCKGTVLYEVYKNKKASSFVFLLTNCLACNTYQPDAFDVESLPSD